MFKLKPNKNLQISTLIGAQTRIDGDVAFSGGFHLDGYINGNVSGEPGTQTTLVVSEHGGIEGSVVASNVLLNGIVKGDIDASGRVELGENARVLGNVQYAVIETAVGAQINGKLIHRSEPASSPAPVSGPVPVSGPAPVSGPVPVNTQVPASTQVPAGSPVRLNTEVPAGSSVVPPGLDPSL